MTKDSLGLWRTLYSVVGVIMVEVDEAVRHVVIGYARYILWIFHVCTTKTLNDRTNSTLKVEYLSISSV